MSHTQITTKTILPKTQLLNQKSKTQTLKTHMCMLSVRVCEHMCTWRPEEGVKSLELATVSWLGAGNGTARALSAPSH